MPDPACVIGDGWIRLHCRVISRTRTSGLADPFQVPQRQAHIERGERSRSKMVRVDEPIALTPELQDLLVS